MLDGCFKTLVVIRAEAVANFVDKDYGEGLGGYETSRILAIPSENFTISVLPYNVLILLDYLQFFPCVAQKKSENFTISSVTPHLFWAVRSWHAEKYLIKISRL